MDGNNAEPTSGGRAPSAASGVPDARGADDAAAGGHHALDRGPLAGLGAGDAPSGDETAVLGGAAARAAVTPAHGTAVTRAGDEAGDAPPAARGTDDDDDRPGRHFRRDDGQDRRNRVVLGIAAAPVVLLVLLVGSWAIDATVLSGQVVRNVSVAGRDVGGLGEAALPKVMSEIAEDEAARPVRIVSDGTTYETTAGAIGLAVDERATAEDALEVGRDQPIFVRPFAWLGSFFRHREVPVSYTVSESDVTTELLELQGDEIQAPVDPTIELTEQGFVAVPGQPGVGVDPVAVAQALPDAAGEDDGPIEIRARRAEFDPRFSDEEAQELADSANQMTANGLVIRAGDEGQANVDAARLRSWLRPTTAEGKLDLTIDEEAVSAALPEVLADVLSEPQDARFTVEGGRVVIVPAVNGVTCCGDDSAERIFEALLEGAGEVTLDVEVTEPELTTAKAEELGIKEPIGGNRAWQNGADTAGPPGFTTYHAPGQARVTNIHRMADMVRGAVVLPGETFSINEHVGERTAAKGFVAAGAIREGKHVDEIGGGVSQFATTLFNAAYFAGLDITTYQAHSEYFTRYPRGREATMGYPAPDLAFKNNTPYGILIWTSYTDTSLTVTMYSTPWATAEQVGISEGTHGNCKVVTTTRQRTFPDGRTATDTFRATYRPGEGQFC